MQTDYAKNEEVSLDTIQDNFSKSNQYYLQWNRRDTRSELLNVKLKKD